jgi:hypothetical protein
MYIGFVKNYVRRAPQAEKIAARRKTGDVTAAYGGPRGLTG